MLDIHTHILPNIDDGSRSVAESVAMIRASMEQGVNRLALTPHFYPERESPKRFLERRGESARELSAALAGMKQLPKMCLGAEVAYFEGMSRTEHIDSLCIGRTRMLLVELPFSSETLPVRQISRMVYSRKMLIKSSMRRELSDRRKVI